MVYYKTDEEIEFLRQSNILVSKTLAIVGKLIKPGVKTIELDKIAEEHIRDNGGVPGFLNYHGFPNTLCVSVNDVVVHGIPTHYELKDGDIVSVDCGVFMNGFHGDSAYTFACGNVAPEVLELMKSTKESLFKAIEAAVVGSRLGNIGFAVQNHVESKGYSVVREMVGHGVGKNLHESPEVPNYGSQGRGILLKDGLVIAIEPMINLGKREIYQDSDGWTIKTKDGKPSAHYEHSIAVRKGKADILSDFSIIEKELYNG